jgi:transcription initiation factor IIE alpha subunit
LCTEPLRIEYIISSHVNKDELSNSNMYVKSIQNDRISNIVHYEVGIVIMKLDGLLIVLMDCGWYICYELKELMN